MSDNNRNAAAPLGLPAGLLVTVDEEDLNAFLSGQPVRARRMGRIVLWHPDGKIEEAEDPG